MDRCAKCSGVWLRRPSHGVLLRLGLQVRACVSRARPFGRAGSWTARAIMLSAGAVILLHAGRLAAAASGASDPVASLPAPVHDSGPYLAGARSTIVATRAAVTPRIDGQLDEVAWRAALPQEGFIQKFPDEGAQPSQR